MHGPDVARAYAAASSLSQGLALSSEIVSICSAGQSRGKLIGQVLDYGSQHR